MLLNPVFKLIKKLLSDSKRFLTEEEIESFAYIIAHTVIHHREGQKEEKIQIEDQGINSKN